MRDTIDMAREAGFNFDGVLYTVRGNHAQLAHLEALVRADEREACAKVCDDLPAPDSCSSSESSLWDVATLECGDAIRARKNNT